MAYKTFAKESLEYHEAKDEYDSNGKIATLITKECNSQEDLSMAYTPGVVYPSLEIAKDKDKAYDYTNKGNLVAIISNGSAVLGVGDIGPLASKPVMEGKAVLFKKFANIDAIDIEVDSNNPKEIINIVSKIAVGFGGINLEDIKAPECFEIERKLKDICNIPIFHNDQHGTAVITTAGLLNVLEMREKKPQDLKIVIIGAGAAAISSAKMYKAIGVKNIYMFDSKGIICKSRSDLNQYKEEFAVNACFNLKEAIANSDMVLGLSKGGVITQEMVDSMAKNPVIFACANPEPEINPKDALEVRDDVIIGTGRADFPNQVNNILVTPHIFRGALDVRATHITENMKMAAAKALAKLAKEQIPTEVKRVLNIDKLSYGVEYIIPSIFDKRVMPNVAFAVAKAAVEDGVAQVKSFIEDRYLTFLTNLSKKL